MRIIFSLLPGVKEEERVREKARVLEGPRALGESQGQAKEFSTFSGREAAQLCPGYNR